MPTASGGGRGFDFDAIRQAHPLIPTAERYGIEVRQETARCWVHDDPNPSVHFYPDGHWNCYGCGAHGDVVDLVAAIRGIEIADAAKELGGKTAPVSIRPAPPQTDPYEAWEPVEPKGDPPRVLEPFTLWNVTREQETTVTPAAIYQYGELGYVLRIEREDGDKFFMTARWCRGPAGQECWCSHRFARPLPLYGQELLDELVEQVILVEGEKACDALQAELFDVPALSVATWPGGGANARHVDLEPLRARHVILWPDADDPGRAAMQKVDERLQGLVQEVKWIEPDPGVPKGWDAADAVSEGLWSLEWAKARTTLVPSAPAVVTQPNGGTAEPALSFKEEVESSRKSAGVQGDPASAAELEKAAREPLPFDEMDQRLRENPYFRCLGHMGVDRAYHDLTTGQFLRVAAEGGHTWHKLLCLAPAAWWRKTFPECGGDRSLTQRAVDQLFRVCASLGPVEPELRGRGAWLEGDELLWHLGDRVIRGGKPIAPPKVQSELGPRPAIYQTQVGLGVEVTGDQATDTQGREFLEICGWLNWQHPPDGRLLAGWVIAAMVGGALHWRPHIWITGESGCGKTTVIEHVLQPVLGDLVSVAVGGSSAAGIRNITVRDSLPVIVDENEGESRDQRDAQQALLALVRAASAGGMVFKADQKGGTVQYHLHSCYCFASVNPQLRVAADANRISNLILLKDRGPDAEGRFQQWLARCYELLHDQEFGRKLFARICAHWPQYRANTETFRVALRRHLPDARHADQASPLVAGAYLLVATDEVTADQAYEWVSKMSWGEAVSSAEEAEHEGMRCLQTILMAQPSFEWKDRVMRPTLYQLLEWTLTPQPEGMSAQEAAKHLAVYGIHAEPGGVFKKPDVFNVATNHEYLGKVLRNTAWAGGWKQALLSIPRAQHAGSKRFGPRTSRSVAIPSSAIRDPDEKPALPLEPEPESVESLPPELDL